MKKHLFIAFILLTAVAGAAQEQSPTATPTPVVRESVTISADFKQLVDQVSKSVTFLDGQELRDRADFSLAESLRSVPGFRIQQLGGFGRTASIKSRGLRNQDTAILIDGIRFRDASSITGDASAFLSDITLTSVSRVEVLRGAGSSLYGTNAVGGTVDFQTPAPRDGFHGTVSGAFGGLGLGRFRGNVSRGWEKFGFGLGLSRTVYTKGIDGNDDARNWNFQPRLEFKPTDRTTISARFFYSDAFVKLNSSPDTFGTLPATNASIIRAVRGVNFTSDVDDPDNSQISKFFSGQGVVTHSFGDRLVFQGFYSGVITSRRNENGVLGAGFQSASTSVFEGTIQTANGHFDFTPNSRNRLTVGYEFENEKFANDGRTPSGSGDFFARARQSSNTIFAQHLAGFLNGDLQLAGGARFQFFRLGSTRFSLTNAPYTGLSAENPESAVTFDGSASYLVRKSGTKFRVHAGNGYRVPSLYERFGTFFSSFGTPSFVALGDPELKPEKSFTIDAAVEQEFLADRVRLSATYFYSKLFETIGFGSAARVIPGVARPFGGYFNTGGGLSRGAEFEGKFKITDTTDVSASYTFTNSVQRVAAVAGNANLKTFGVPDNQFALVATQRIKRAWVNFDFTASSSYLAPVFSNSTFSTYVFRFKGNRRGDLTGGYTIPFRRDSMTVRVFGTIENLFDYEYFENGFRTTGRTGRLGVSFGF